MGDTAIIEPRRVEHEWRKSGQSSRAIREEDRGKQGKVKHRKIACYYETPQN